MQHSLDPEEMPFNGHSALDSLRGGPFSGFGPAWTMQSAAACISGLIEKRKLRSIHNQIKVVRPPTAGPDSLKEGEGDERSGQQAVTTCVSGEALARKSLA